MSNVRSLRDKSNRADKKFSDRDNELRILREDAIRQAKKNIYAFFDVLYAQELNDLETARTQSKDALDAELEAVALSGEGSPYPIGTKLCKIVSQRRVGYIRSVDTTIYGVVDVWTRTSENPKNELNWRTPSVGTFVVRHVLANGQAGKKYDTSFRDWTPVDQTVQRNEKFFRPVHIEL